MTIPFATPGKRPTSWQLASLEFHVYWRDLPFYQRWVDKHG